MYVLEQKKNCVYPCKPQFYFIKVGREGYKLHGCVIMMYMFISLKTIPYTMQLMQNYRIVSGTSVCTYRFAEIFII